MTLYSKQLQSLNDNSKQIIVTLLKIMDNNECHYFILSIIYRTVSDHYINIPDDVTLHQKDVTIATSNDRTMDSTSIEQMNKFLKYLFQQINDNSLEAAVFLDCFNHLCDNVLQLSSATCDQRLQYENGLVLLVVTDMCEHKADQLLSRLGVNKMLSLSSRLLQHHCDAVGNSRISLLDNHPNHLDNKIFGGQITMSIALGMVTMVMTCSQKVIQLIVASISYRSCILIGPIWRH